MTVSELIEFYKNTNEFNKLRPNSRNLYTLMITSAVRVLVPKSQTIFGQLKLENVTPTYTDKLYAELKATKGLHRATFVCKIMRKIWFVGKRHGLVATNPFERMGIEGLEDRAVLWQPYEVYQFIKTSDELGYTSLGTIALLCYHLCQRPGDMRMLEWSDYDGQSFKFKQEKTSTEVVVPASPQLQERLHKLPLVHKLPCESSYISPCESTGKPYDRFLYSQHFRKIRKAAGLGDHLQLRDLRRTGATEMAEAGCTEDELRSVTGHKSRDILSIYVRPTVKLAQAGVSKRFKQDLAA